MDISDKRIVSVVDDDESMRRSVRSLLSSVGYCVETFESADAFLHSSHRENTGCLVLDLRMPGMNGEELLVLLANAGKSIPTVILTAHGDSFMRERLRSFDVLAFLGKPFKKELLLGAVAAAMGHKL